MSSLLHVSFDLICKIFSCTFRTGCMTVLVKEWTFPSVVVAVGSVESMVKAVATYGYSVILSHVYEGALIFNV